MVHCGILGNRHDFLILGAVGQSSRVDVYLLGPSPTNLLHYAILQSVATDTVSINAFLALLPMI